MLGGGTFDLASERGHVVVMNFWGSWCGPCRAEAADLESAYKASGVVFIGVNVEDQQDAASAFISAHGITYPSIFDPAGHVMLAFAQVPPTRCAIDSGDRRGREDRVAPPGADLHGRLDRDDQGGADHMSFASVAASGPIVLAIGAAATAGLVSFLSPCVLPLVPGYLSYMTGLAGADLDSATDGDNPQRARMVGRIMTGTLLFIAGFTVFFTLTAWRLRISAGRWPGTSAPSRSIGGVVVIVLGAAFLGLIPGMQREWRIRKLPSAGLLGAPVLGAVFAVSWVPCIGPTLGTVLMMSYVSGQTGRAVMLAAAYCLGLGLPFLIFGLGFRRLIGVFRAIRRNSRWVTRIGGALLVVIGLALVFGEWMPFMDWLRVTFGVGGAGI